MEGVFRLAFVAYRINGGILDKKRAEEGWDFCVGSDYANEKTFADFRIAINDLFVEDEENGLMRNPEEGFVDRGDETCEDDDPQKDDGSVEESEMLGKD